MYKENPKTKGSGIVCGIPQIGICPMKCADCFFQSGRSYLEPLDDNLPNLPNELDMSSYRILRVNDGNDSSHHYVDVIEAVKNYPMKFYNTSMDRCLSIFDAPVVLTVNPGMRTDTGFTQVKDIPKNLMFVRARVNAWNLEKVVDKVVDYYSERGIPVILTFMAYFKEKIPEGYEAYYTFRKRTLNSYWAITTAGWEKIMARYKYNKWVHSCGKIEGEKGASGCRFCGNCLREYFATMERNNIVKLGE
jgi:hypothetical protein